MSASEKLKALDSRLRENGRGGDDVLAALPLLVAVVEWVERYANAEDWHAYVGTEGGRIDDEVDALLAALNEALT